MRDDASKRIWLKRGRACPVRGPGCALGEVGAPQGVGASPMTASSGTGVAGGRLPLRPLFATQLPRPRVRPSRPPPRTPWSGVRSPPIGARNGPRRLSTNDIRATKDRAQYALHLFVYPRSNHRLCSGNKLLSMTGCPTRSILFRSGLRRVRPRRVEAAVGA